MNLPIKPLETFRAVVGAGQPQSVVKTATVSSAGFRDAIVQALKETSSLQKESGRLSKEFTLENSTVSLEQTMLAGVKSNISFQVNLQIRNRVVQAYSDVMNMQI